MNSNLGFGDFLILCCGGLCVGAFALFALATGTLGRLLGIGSNLLNRPRVFFNDPNLRSGGRVGGNPGFTNPYRSSGGSIGGGESFSNPTENSSGSIGGRA